MSYIIVFVISYLIGSISGAYIIGKIFLNKDIRKYGSGNAGTTNAMRVLGKKAGILTFLIDFLKGVFVAFLINILFSRNYVPLSIFAAVLGHDFPFYMNFKGGKGVATTLGALAFLDLKLTFICYLVWLVSTLITKIVSVGSIGFYIFVIAIFTIYSDLSISNKFIIVMVALLGIWRHKDNIKRLLKGTENKIGGVR
ncbi:glycerol-3-phosphate acyltransferase PlsY [Peptoniphilus olsenii]|uniref:Glycerol-3-phosphate acyltransferase n=1 Tax=Peptoniphilus olsenii TaxID=411570 RepID=A0ABV2J6P4_9FIRM